MCFCIILCGEETGNSFSRGHPFTPVVECARTDRTDGQMSSSHSRAASVDRSSFQKVNQIYPPSRCCWWWVFPVLGRATGPGLAWGSTPRSATSCWAPRSCSHVWLSVKPPVFALVRMSTFRGDARFLSECLTCLCAEWRTEGQRAAAGLSVPRWFDQDRCSDSWQLHPRPGDKSI